MYATLKMAMTMDIANAPENIKTPIRKFNRICSISEDNEDLNIHNFTKALYTSEDEKEDPGLIWLLSIHTDEVVQQAMYKYLHGLEDMLPTMATSAHIEFLIRIYCDLGYKYARIVKAGHKKEIDMILTNVTKILFNTDYNIRGLAYDSAKILNKTFNDTSYYDDIQKMIYTLNDLADKCILKDKPSLSFCPPNKTAYYMIMGSARINAMLVEAAAAE